MADNVWLARKALTKLNLVVLQIGRFDIALMWNALSNSIEKLTRRVKIEEQLVLMSQLETGISVGIPIIQMLDMLGQDQENKIIKQALTEIAADITQGGSLHEAFAKHPLLFNPTMIGLVKTGELTGKLEETLARINQMIEQESKNRTKVKSAVFYPKIVVFVLGIVFFAVVYFIIPKLKTFLSAMGTDLPPITVIVVGISDFFVSYWYLVLILGFGIRQSFIKYTSTETGRLKFDQFKLKVPFFGIIFHFLELNNLCVILELLISSGIPLMDALEILKDSQKNMVFKHALTKCQEEIAKGSTLTKGMEGLTVFPVTFRNLLSMGEESGRMQPGLLKLGRYYQVQIDYRLDNLSKLIEPILLAVIFGMVLTLALAILLPIWKINEVMRPKF